MGAEELEYHTYEDYLQIDKNKKDTEMIEFIFGNIYMMSGASAKHQDVVLNIAVAIKAQNKKTCKPRIAPFDLKITLGGEINIAQPDVMIFCDGKTLPCAVFEVLSKSTGYKDRGIKKDLYEMAEITEYFIVDTRLKIIDKYLLDGGKYYYVKGFNAKENEMMKIDCADIEVSIAEIFEDIEEVGETKEEKIQ